MGAQASAVRSGPARVAASQLRNEPSTRVCVNHKSSHLRGGSDNGTHPNTQQVPIFLVARRPRRSFQRLGRAQRDISHQESGHDPFYLPSKASRARNTAPPIAAVPSPPPDSPSISPLP